MKYKDNNDLFFQSTELIKSNKSGLTGCEKKIFPVVSFYNDFQRSVSRYGKCIFDLDCVQARGKNNSLLPMIFMELKYRKTKDNLTFFKEHSTSEKCFISYNERGDEQTYKASYIVLNIYNPKVSKGCYVSSYYNLIYDLEFNIKNTLYFIPKNGIRYYNNRFSNLFNSYVDKILQSYEWFNFLNEYEELWLYDEGQRSLFEQRA